MSKLEQDDRDVVQEIKQKARNQSLTPSEYEFYLGFLIGLIERLNKKNDE